jgi:uncharacterized caspase-like protein
MPPEHDSPPGPRLALVVATTTYADPGLRRLRAPARDAADLAQVLADPGIGGFTVTTAIDQTAQEIRLALEDFLDGRGTGDLLLVYLSCHGLLNARRRLFFAATDTRKDRLGATGVESAWVLDQLEHCRARRQVLILDSCFSGAFAHGAKGEADLGLKDRFLGEGRGRVVLTASTATEYSFEGDPTDAAAAAGSVFTAALVEGLRTGAADTDHDGYVSVEDAYGYVFDQVQAAGAAQTPQHWLYGGQGRILLARNPAGPLITPASLPESLQVGLDSRHPGIRVGAVTELGEWLTSGDPVRAATARQHLQEIADTDIPRVAHTARTLLDTGSRPDAPAVVDRPTSTTERRSSVDKLHGSLFGSPAVADRPTSAPERPMPTAPRPPTPAMTALPDPGHSRAVLIGSSTYRHLANLPAIGNNLSAFRDVLVDPALGGLPADNCTVVAEPATPIDVYRELRKHAAAAEDTLLVYFAGHSRTGSRNELWLCLGDTDPDELPYSAWSYDELRGVVADSPACRKVVILDCILSGRFLPDLDLAGPGEAVGHVGIEGSYLLAATAGNAVAAAAPVQRYTAFTGALLGLLNEGVPDGPELLTFEQIFHRLQYTLRSRGLAEASQSYSGTIADLALTRNPAYAGTRNLADTGRGGTGHFNAPVRVDVAAGSDLSSLSLWARSDTSTSQDPYALVGRNEPCPCGSGRKFKTCHGDPRNRADG